MHTEYYKDGTPCKCDYMRRGYDENGNVDWETPYVNNKRHGIGKEYDNGFLILETSFVNGKRQGDQNSYFDSGGLIRKTPYKNNTENGVEKWYNESGVLIDENVFSNGMHISCVSTIKASMENFV